MRYMPMMRGPTTRGPTMRRAARGFALAVLLALSAPCRVAAAAATPVTGWANVAARVIPATVNILVVKVVGSYRKDKNDEPDPANTVGERKRYAGSGFIVDPSGIIVTNRHMVNGALWITVRLEDGTELPAKLVAASPVVDLALLQVNAGHPLPALKLAPGNAVRVGDPVLAIGDPLGLGTSVSAGIVSGLQRDLMNTPFDDYVQTDAAINHGNSGGPLIDAAGEVIGVNTILLTNQPNEGSNGLGFAISSTVVAAALRHLLHPEQQPIGWIGVQLEGMTPNLTRALHLLQAGGFILTGVDPASPARQAGLAAGDVILRYGQQTPANARALMRDIATTPIGQTRELAVWQNGRTRQVSVTVRTLAAGQRGARRGGGEPRRPSAGASARSRPAAGTDQPRRAQGIQAGRAEGRPGGRSRPDVRSLQPRPPARRGDREDPGASSGHAGGGDAPDPRHRRTPAAGRAPGSLGRRRTMDRAAYRAGGADRAVGADRNARHFRPPHGHLGGEGRPRARGAIGTAALTSRGAVVPSSVARRIVRHGRTIARRRTPHTLRPRAAAG